MNKVHFSITTVLLFIVLALMIIKAMDNFEITNLLFELEKCQAAAQLCVDIANGP